MRDGTLRVWGANTYGQLGLPVADRVSTPTAPVVLPSIITGTTSRAHTALLREDGGLLLLGDGSQGQLGDGLTQHIRAMPAQPNLPPDLYLVSASSRHVMGLYADGRLWTWGDNARGQMADGGTRDWRLPSPIALSLGASPVFMRAGDGASFVLLADGRLFARGRNDLGQLGLGDLVDRPAPTQVHGLPPVTFLHGGMGHVVARAADGTIWTWGDNRQGQLGDASPAPSRPTPAQVPSLPPIRVVSAASGYTLALDNTGRVWAWGANDNGQLGDGGNTARALPKLVPDLTGIGGISAGPSHALARSSNGALYAWGRNSRGQLGDGTTQLRRSPVQVARIDRVRTIAAGFDHSVAVREDGTVWTFGSNSRGQLGLEPGPDQLFAAPLSALPPVSRASAGESFSLVQFTDGTLRAFGDNRQGQLGVVQPRRATPSINLRFPTPATDTDADGLPDSWELNRFGHLRQTAATDADRDALPDGAEYALGTDPTLADADLDALTDLIDPAPFDFFNGRVPLLATVGGDGQLALPGALNSAPFDIAVWDETGTRPLARAPLLFSVSSGGGFLQRSHDTRSPERLAEATIRADIDGSSRAWYRHPTVDDHPSVIRVTAGGASLSITTRTLPIDLANDLDSDGLTLAQEIAAGTDPSMPDTDGDGLLDGDESGLGLNPATDDALSLVRALPGLRLHLAADRGLEFDENGAVAIWRDQSGRGNDAIQASAEARPQAFMPANSARPLVGFDGADDFMELPPVLSQAEEGELFIVGRANSLTHAINPLARFGEGLGAGYGLLDGIGGFFDDFGTIDVRHRTLPTLDLAPVIMRLHLFHARRTLLGRSSSGFNGVTYRSEFTPGQARFAAAPLVGANLEGGRLSGEIAEILVFDRPLGPEPRARLSAYLAARHRGAAASDLYGDDVVRYRLPDLNAPSLDGDPDARPYAPVPPPEDASLLFPDGVYPIIEAVSGQDQPLVPGSYLPKPLVLSVKYPDGRPCANIRLFIEVFHGGGTVEGDFITDEEGLVALRWFIPATP